MDLAIEKIAADVALNYVRQSFDDGSAFVARLIEKVSAIEPKFLLDRANVDSIIDPFSGFTGGSGVSNILYEYATLNGNRDCLTVFDPWASMDDMAVELEELAGIKLHRLANGIALSQIAPITPEGTDIQFRTAISFNLIAFSCKGPLPVQEINNQAASLAERLSWIAFTAYDRDGFIVYALD